ncbi:MAG: spore coat protein [Firmicutes bacterium]|nr:spore coat protein [Bacillota bacterium]
MNKIMNDNEIAVDTLASHKALMQLYCTGLIESSCQNQRKLYNELFAECAKDQFEVFEYMQKKGLYPTEDAPDSKVTQAQEKFEGLKGSLC